MRPKRMGHPGSVSDLFCCWFGGGALDDEVVIYAERAGGGVGLHACDGFVHFVVNHTIESDVAVFYDDVDGVEADGRIVGDATGHEGYAATARSESACEGALVGVVFRQGGLGVDAVVDGGADAVVVGGV